MSQSMATLPDPVTYDGDNFINGQRPRALMNNFAHLMKDTKSSAMRNAQTYKASYKSNSSFNTLDITDQGVEEAWRESSPKKKAAKPRVPLARSPNKKKANNSPEKITSNQLYGKDNEHEDDIEGITGIVKSGNKKNAQIIYDELQKGESVSDTDNSSGSEKQNDKVEATSLQQTPVALELEIIQITSAEDIQAPLKIEEAPEPESKHKEFEKDIMLIMDNIKSQALAIQSQISLSKDQKVDPLQQVALDLSQESSDALSKSCSVASMTENDNDQDQSSSNVNLDQTILIGEVDDISMFDNIRPTNQSPDKEKEAKGVITQVELEQVITDLKLKHRAELDTIVLEQSVYKKIIYQMLQRLKKQNKQIDTLQEEKLKLNKYEELSKKLFGLVETLKVDNQFYQSQIDKYKIALIEYDKHVHKEIIFYNDHYLQELELENQQLRRLLKIPDDLFKVDPEEEKKKEAEKKKNMLKSIDDKLKQAEKKLAKKQSASEMYYQQQREHGFDPFELDQMEYDMYQMSKLKEHTDMPKAVKEQVHGKIYSRIEERSFREEMRRQHERDILEEYARAYGYDIHKHQPHYNNGEIDVEYL